MWLKVIPWSRNKFLQEIYWRWYVNDKPEKQVEKKNYLYIYTHFFVKTVNAKLMPLSPTELWGCLLYFTKQHLSPKSGMEISYLL